jgi:hypothetical protein
VERNTKTDLTNLINIFEECIADVVKQVFENRMEEKISTQLKEWDFTKDDNLMESVRVEVEKYFKAHLVEEMAERLNEIPMFVDDIQNFDNGVKEYLKRHLEEEIDRILAKPIEPNTKTLEWFEGYVNQTVEEKLRQRKQHLSPLYWLRRWYGQWSNWLVSLRSE